MALKEVAATDERATERTQKILVSVEEIEALIDRRRVNLPDAAAFNRRFFQDIGISLGVAALTIALFIGRAPIVGDWWILFVGPATALYFALIRRSPR